MFRKEHVSQTMKQTNKRLVIILTAALIGIALLLALILPPLSQKMEINQQFDIAAQYLADLDYEPALMAFSKILEIDPQNVEAYLQMAETYIAMDNQDAAIEILEKGYSVTGDERLSVMLENILAGNTDILNPSEIPVINDPEIDAAIRQYLGIDVDTPMTAEHLERIGEISITPTSIQIQYNPILEGENMLVRAADPSFIDFINACPYGYTTISLWEYSGPEPDLTPFAKIERLHELSLYDIPFKNLEFLRLFPQIIRLDLHLDGYDLEPLRDLKMDWGTLFITANEQETLDAFLPIAAEYENLSSMWINSANSSDFSGVSALSDLKNLYQLCIDAPNLSDISPIASLTQLTYLCIDTLSCESTAPLSTLVNLQSFNMRGYTHTREHDYQTRGKLTDLSALAYMPHLEDIDVSFNNISDVSPLNGHEKLRNIYLHENSISDISTLTDIPAIERLSLDDNLLSDISVLANNTALHELHIYSNSITDISIVRTLPALRTLSFGDNPITDLSPLSDMPSDSYLNALDCPVSDWSPVAHIDDVYGRPE